MLVISMNFLSCALFGLVSCNSPCQLLPSDLWITQMEGHWSPEKVMNGSTCCWFALGTCGQPGGDCDHGQWWPHCRLRRYWSIKLAVTRWPVMTSQPGPPHVRYPHEKQSHSCSLKKALLRLCFSWGYPEPWGAPVDWPWGLSAAIFKGLGLVRAVIS